MSSLVQVSRALSRAVSKLEFSGPVTHVYNPLRYAAHPFRQYLERYGKGRRRALLLGMNPGPFGMVQTGVPFGEVSLVRDWMGIDEPVDHPDPEHPKRPVQGFDCTRSEVSGQRLWGAIAGFTSFVSHTGGPPLQMYLLPQRLPPPLFAGTSVVFFAVVNWLNHLSTEHPKGAQESGSTLMLSWTSGPQTVCSETSR